MQTAFQNQGLIYIAREFWQYAAEDLGEELVLG